MTAEPADLFSADGLVGGSCRSCTQRHFPSAGWCPWCGGEEVQAVTLSTRGTLWSWTAVRAAPPGYEGGVPYGFGVVELPDDGLRVVTRLTESDPARLRLDQAVVFQVIDLDDGNVTWAYGPR